MALHTAGSLLNWHPRLHGVFLDGGILPDGSFVQLPQVDTALLQEFFAERVFAFLLEADLIALADELLESSDEELALVSEPDAWKDCFRDLHDASAEQLREEAIHSLRTTSRRSVQATSTSNCRQTVCLA